MTDKELINLLKSVKDAPELGGGFDSGRHWNLVADRCGFEQDVKPRSYTFQEYVEYVMWRVGHGFLRPAAVALSAFALVFTGWVAAVNASFDSVPGDYLYPVKLATERVQLTFASSESQRAKLHVEFAGRRLEEVTEIERSDRPGKDVRTRAALEGFTKEIQSANTTLSALNDTNADEAVTLAIVIDQKTDEYEKTIGNSGVVAEDETKDVLAGALVTVGEVNTKAVDAIVQQNEVQARPETSESLQKNFQDGYADIKMRITLSHGRLAVVESALASLPNVEEKAYAPRINDAREALSGHDSQINKAMDLFAAGAIRNAFDLLAEIKADVRTSEEIITELEIEISTKLVSQSEEAAEANQSIQETQETTIESPNF